MTSQVLRTALVWLVAIFGTVQGSQAQSITNVSPQEKSVNDAIEKAKKTLPDFFARLAKPQPGDSQFLVKIRYDVGSGSEKSGEHIWAQDVVRGDDKVTATIANVPVKIQNLSKGDRVTVPTSQVTDWLYVRDGKYRGAYTVRALLPFMKPDEAADMKKRLGPE